MHPAPDVSTVQALPRDAGANLMPGYIMVKGESPRRTRGPQREKVCRPLSSIRCNVPTTIPPHHDALDTLSYAAPGDRTVNTVSNPSEGPNAIAQ